MAKLIRKISVGKDYKNDAMHYAVGQEVYGGHTISNIIEEEDKYSIYKLMIINLSIHDKISAFNFFSIVISFSYWCYNKVVNTFH